MSAEETEKLQLRWVFIMLLYIKWSLHLMISIPKTKQLPPKLTFRKDNSD